MRLSPKSTLKSGRPRADVRRELEVEGRFVIGNFARLIDVKGHRYLIEAMSRLRPRFPEAVLLLIGDGAERATRAEDSRVRARRSRAASGLAPRCDGCDERG